MHDHEGVKSVGEHDREDSIMERAEEAVGRHVLCRNTRCDGRELLGTAYERREHERAPDELRVRAPEVIKLFWVADEHLLGHSHLLRRNLQPHGKPREATSTRQRAERAENRVTHDALRTLPALGQGIAQGITPDSCQP